MESNLKNAFRWHRQNNIRNGAAYALAAARIDVANGRTRYPAPVKPFPAFGATDESGRRWSENPERAGLRLVGRVVADCGGRNGIWDNQESSGWYSDECQNNLCFGVVYQLPGHKGESRFVAGYAFTDADGVSLDLSRIYAEPAAWFEPVRKSATGYVMGGYWSWQDNPREMDAARDAAFAADSMAQAEAEAEREYQTAWRAGSIWAELGAGIESDRKDLLAMLAERRAAKGSAAYPALCKALKREVSRLLAAIAEARSERADLAAGDYRDLCFWPGEQGLKDAFCDGAGLARFPA